MKTARRKPTLLAAAVPVGYVSNGEPAAMDYGAHFVRDPGICGGETIIKGTRVPLRTVLASLAEGGSIAEVLADFPSLREQDLRAVIAFAAASAEEDLPVPVAGTGP